MTDKGITGELLQSRIEVQHFEWRIVDFLSLSGGKDDRYKSPPFHFMESRWYFGIYPGGLSSDSWVGLFLMRDDPGPPKSVKYTFEIKNESLLGDKFQKLYSGCNTFEVGINSSWGLRNAFKRSELLEKKCSLLPSGNLTIRYCMKNANAETITVSPQPMKLTELVALSEDLGNLLVCGANCDVTLKVQNKEFRTHRSILASRSEIFASMFEHGLSESSTGVVDIVDCHPDSFGDFLHYLYTGKVEEVTQDNVMHLYKTADKYAVLKLKSFCVEFMTCHLSDDNVCAVATLAQQYDEDELLASVQLFFNRNVGRILSTKSWEKLLREDYLLANRLMKEMASKIKIED